MEQQYYNQTMKVAYVFMIIGTILLSFLILPLCWTIPMTKKTKDLIYKHEPATGLGVCAILFVSMIGGILILVANNAESYKKVDSTDNEFSNNTMNSNSAESAIN